MGWRFARTIVIHTTWLALIAWASPAAAQIPSKFRNLKVLPKDITKQQLVATMRGFAGGLGVRCNHCHMGGGPSGELKGMDFASDAKKAKRTARVMLSMVNQINGKLIPKAAIENPVQVQCVTCHHGVTRPESLADLLRKEFATGGMDSLRSTYRSLRKEHYGGSAYDFKPRTLNEVAEALAAEKKVDAAIAVMRFNLEQDPNEAYSYNLLGRLQAEQGDKAGAMASFKKAIELDPSDTWSEELLKKLEAEAPK